MRRLFVLAVTLLAAGLCAIAPTRAQELTLQAASAENLAKPHDIVLSPDGTRLFVADNDNDRIVVLDPWSLAELGTFGEGEVAAPHDVVFDAGGRLLVADTRNDRIAIYAIDGAHGRLVESIEERIRAPEGVGVHADGRVFATGARSGNLVVYADGEVVGEMGFRTIHQTDAKAQMVLRAECTGLCVFKRPGVTSVDEEAASDDETDEAVAEQPSLTVAAVQTNIPQNNKLGWELEDQIRDFARFVELTREAKRRGKLFSSGKTPHLVARMTGWPHSLTAFPTTSSDSPKP